MPNWMPNVRHDDRGGSGPASSDGSNVILLHTTETDGPAAYNGSEPHFEVGVRREWTRQLVSLDRAARALYNAAGGVETNRQGRVIQIEIIWRAHKAREMPDGLLTNLAEVVRFIRENVEVPLVKPPQGFWMPGTIATPNSPLRFGGRAWNEFAGFAGHVNVPENDHWDPGDFPWDRFIRILTNNSPEELFTMSQFDELNAKLDAIINDRFAKEVLAELKAELAQAAGTDNWHNVGESLSHKLNSIEARLVSVEAKLSSMSAPGGVDQETLKALVQQAVRTAGLKIS